MMKTTAHRIHIALTLATLWLLHACKTPAPQAAAPEEKKATKPLQAASTHPVDTKQKTQQPPATTAQLPAGASPHKSPATPPPTPSPIAQYGFKAKWIASDGNCLFRAIADQLQHRVHVPMQHNAKPYRILRRIAADHIISNMSLYRQFTTAQTIAAVEQLIHQMEQDRVWAGEEALAVLSRALQVTIVVVRDRADNVTVYKPARSQATIYLYYKNGVHYESLYADPSLRATRDMETLVKAQAADKDFVVTEVPSLAPFVERTAKCLEAEAKLADSSSGQRGALSHFVTAPSGPPRAAQADLERAQLHSAIEALLPQAATDAKTLATLAEKLEALLKLERLWGTQGAACAQTYLERLHPTAQSTANSTLTALLTKAYCQALSSSSIAEFLSSSAAGTPQRMAVLQKFAAHCQAAASTMQPDEAAICYQTLLRHVRTRTLQSAPLSAYAALAAITSALLPNIPPCSAADLQQQIAADGRALQPPPSATKPSHQKQEAVRTLLQRWLATCYQESEKALGPAPCPYAVMGRDGVTPTDPWQWSVLMKDPQDETIAQKGRTYLQQLTQLVQLRASHIVEMRTQAYHDGLITVSDKVTATELQRTWYVCGHKALYSTYAQAQGPAHTPQPGTAHEHYGDYKKALAAYEASHKQLKARCGTQPDAALARSYHRLGRMHCHTGSYHQALTCHYRALAVWTTLYGKAPHMATAYGYECIGDVHYKQGSTFKAWVHFESARTMYSACATSQSDLARIWDKMGDAHRRLGEEEKAIAAYQQAEQLWHTLGRAAHTTTAKLGEVYKARRQYEEALLIYQRILPTILAAEDTPPLQLTTYAEQLGDLYQQQSDYKRAKPYYAKALQRYKTKNTPGTAAQIANCQRNLGDICYYQDDYSEALGHYQQALKHFQAQEHSYDAAQCWRKIGSVHKQQKAYDKALSCYQKAFGLYQRQAPPVITLAVLHDDIASCYKALTRHAEASKHYAEALQRYQSQYVYGTTPNFTVAYCLKNMGDVCQNLGRINEAIHYYEQVAKMYRNKALYGTKPNMVVALVLNDLGLLCQQCGLYDKALTYYQQTLDIYQDKSTGEPPQGTKALILNGMGMIHQIQGTIDQAMACYERALKLYETQYGKSHTSVELVHKSIALLRQQQRKPVSHQFNMASDDWALYCTLANSCQSTGDDCFRQKAYAQAQTHYEQALEHRLKLFKDQLHPDLGKAYSQLGAVHVAQERYEAAVTYYEQAHAVYSACLGEEHAQAQQVLKALENVYISFSQME